MPVATPNELRSASESICAPNGLATPNLRASAPSQPSKTTQAKIASAASRSSPLMARKTAAHTEQQARHRAAVRDREFEPAGRGALTRQQAGWWSAWRASTSSRSGVAARGAGLTGARRHRRERPECGTRRAGMRRRERWRGRQHRAGPGGDRRPGSRRCCPRRVTTPPGHLGDHLGGPRAAAAQPCPPTSGGTGAVQTPSPTPDSRHC